MAIVFDDTEWYDGSRRRDDLIGLWCSPMQQLSRVGDDRRLIVGCRDLRHALLLQRKHATRRLARDSVSMA